jgi:hypothetical protein
VISVDLYRHRADRQESVIGTVEDNPPRSPPFDPHTAFVNGPVVCLAEQDQVLRGRLASLGPVLDVVGLQVPSSVTSGKPAGSVSADQGPPQWLRYPPGLAPDVQDIPFGVIRDGHMRCITGQASTRFRGNPISRTPFRKAFLRTVRQDVRINVNRDLIGSPGPGFPRILCKHEPVGCYICLLSMWKNGQSSEFQIPHKCYPRSEVIR